MPLKDKKRHSDYDKGYYAGYRKATLDHLGSKCVKCGGTGDLEIDHVKPLMRRARSLKDLRDLSKLQILCKKCNGRKGDHETKPSSRMETHKPKQKL